MGMKRLGINSRMIELNVIYQQTIPQFISLNKKIIVQVHQMFNVYNQSLAIPFLNPCLIKSNHLQNKIIHQTHRLRSLSSFPPSNIVKHFQLPTMVKKLKLFLIFINLQNELKSINMEPSFNRNLFGTRASKISMNQFRRQIDSQRQKKASQGFYQPFQQFYQPFRQVRTLQRPCVHPRPTTFPQKIRPTPKAYDISYFRFKAKEKIEIIQKQSLKLRKRIQNSKNQQQIFSIFLVRKDSLLQQIKELRSVLKDYNIALEKLKVNTPEEVEKHRSQIKAKNEKLKKQLDDIFIQRKKLEKQISQTKRWQQNIHNLFQLRLKQLDLAKREEYDQLIKEKQQLRLEEYEKQKDLQQLSIKLTITEERLKEDIRKLKGLKLKQQIQKLEERKNEYQIQLNEIKLAIPEAISKILTKMKEDNQAIVVMEKRLRNYQKNVNIYEKILIQLEINSQDGKIQEQEKKKYEILYQKQEEIDAFLNSFDKVRQKELLKLLQLENQIVFILENNSKMIDSSEPKQNNFKGKGTIKTSFQIKLNDLRILKDVQSKVEKAKLQVMKETQDLRTKIISMNSEISNKFNKTQEMSSELFERMSKLMKQQKELQTLKVQLEEKVSLSSKELQMAQKRYELKENFRSYGQVEQKLQNNERQAYYLQHFIRTRSKESQYEEVKDECLSVIEELNEMMDVC